MIHFHVSQSACLLFTSAGATGSARLRTGTATRAPIVLQATEEDAGITCATKVCDAIWFPYQDAQTLPSRSDPGLFAHLQRPQRRRT